MPPWRCGYGLDAPATVVNVTRFFPGRPNWVRSRADAARRELDMARMAGSIVELRARITHGPKGELHAFARVQCNTPEPEHLLPVQRASLAPCFLSDLVSTLPLQAGCRRRCPALNRGLLC